MLCVLISPSCALSSSVDAASLLSQPPHPERPSGPGSDAPFPGDRCRPYLLWPLWGAVAPLQGCWEGARHGTKPGFPLSVKPGFD